MTKRLVLVRHARIAGAHGKRLIGRSDFPLDSYGSIQAEALSDRLHRWNPERCYSSPLTRCRQTAAAATANLPIRVDSRLREVDFGRWENQTFEEVAQKEPAAVNHWGTFAEDFTFPDGESLQEFAARVQDVVAEMIRQPSETVVAFTHGGVIRTMLCQLLGLAPEKYVAFEIGYAAVAVVHLFGGRGVLAELEQAGELADG